MKLKIATPVSHLFAKPNKHLDEAIALSDILELRNIETGYKSGLIKVYHSELSLVEKWKQQELEKTAKIINANNIEFASFHLHSCYEKFLIKNLVFFPSKLLYTKEDMFRNAEANITELNKMLKRKVSFAVENNNFFPTGAYDIVTEARFINALMQKFGLRMVLDIGHAEITAFYKKISLDGYIRSFEFKNIFQIHLSGIKKSADACEDAHNRLKSKDWKLFCNYYPLFPELRYVTIEYYKDTGKLCLMLKKLKSIIDTKLVSKI
jgi:uncharacterized protein (UPF0276 family)